MATSSTSPGRDSDGARRDAALTRDDGARLRASADNAPEPLHRDQHRSEHRPEEAYLALAERIAYWMDRRYIDPILGFLVPGAGDAIGAGIGLLSVYAAFRMRAHPVVIARMLIHLAADSLLGSIPIVGAIADFFYKSHTRNLALLRARDVRTPKPSDWLIVAGAALLFVGALLLPLVVVAALATWLLQR